ncbi:TIGR02391 family protein [Conexibacter sp. JD483]|uniref:TIGR02391 family protein n=1 Tax=unclassified Conexibacter TaxID=2627773 RepID=UPI00271CF6C1|nr:MULTISPECIES: TIGR02391 family protein [unclassified Conexibacter]MDO8184656.1 TIGR02391 family protein [Conexibacter sp. CPCC 205706]MDO8197962.1 TIGR02391 family protein [Conexibacter sp. CPCC 205762]MDR9368392.1 TIGR02391 family protein [Conexibacter sp. JD483]
MEAVEPGDLDITADDNVASASHGQLTLSELHPLIARAADPLWAQMDYGGAVEAAWYSLRDELRDLLDSQADGARLVNLIADSDPRLQLTDFVTETDQSMHRGILRFLAGIVFYVRNPMAHDASPPYANDPIRCFEYLAIMSLCARHLAIAAHPTTVDEIVAEAGQSRFSATSEAIADLVGSLPAAQLPALVGALATAFREAFESEDAGKATNLRQVYIETLELHAANRPILRRAARICARYLADDRTFDIGIALLNGVVFTMLPVRHQANVVNALVRDTREARRVDGRATGGGRYFMLVPTVFGVVGPRDQMMLFRAFANRFRARDPAARAYAASLVGALSHHVVGNEWDTTANMFVAAVMNCEPNDGVYTSAWDSLFVMNLDFLALIDSKLRVVMEATAESEKESLEGIRPREGAERVARTARLLVAESLKR